MRVYLEQNLEQGGGSHARLSVCPRPIRSSFMHYEPDSEQLSIPFWFDFKAKKSRKFHSFANGKSTPDPPAPTNILRAVAFICRRQK